MELPSRQCKPCRALGVPVSGSLATSGENRSTPLLCDHKGDEHAGPDDIEEMPVTGAVVDRPVTFMIVAVSRRLVDDETKKDYTAKNMQGMDKRERKRHPIDFCGTVALAEVSGEQIEHAEALN